MPPLSVQYSSLCAWSIADTSTYAWRNAMGSKESQPFTVLIAEDDDDIRFLLRKFMGSRGIRVVEAETGIEAVEAARLGHPSLILMDLSMPGIDGIEASRRIRRDVSLRNVPIVFLTAHGDYGIRLFGESELMDAGGPFEYLTKPLDPSLLEGILDKYRTG